MAEEARNVPDASKRQASLDIPWMRLWEKTSERERAASENDVQTRLFNIDYMTMLEELEFH